MADQTENQPAPSIGSGMPEKNPSAGIGAGNSGNVAGLEPERQGPSGAQDETPVPETDSSRLQPDRTADVQWASSPETLALLDAIAQSGTPFGLAAGKNEPQGSPVPEVDEILVIEQQNGIDALFDEYIAAASDRQKIFVASLPQADVLTKAAAQRKLNIDERLIYLKKLDLQLDDALYTSAKALARSFVDCLKAASSAVAQDEWTLLPQPAELALEVGLVDRFASVIRPFLQLGSIIATHPGARIRFIARPYTRIDALNHYFKCLGVEKFEIITSHLGKLKPRSSAPLKLLNGNRVFRRGKNYDFEKIAPTLSDKTAFFAVNLPEQLYGKTFEAVAGDFRRTPNKYAVFCSNHLEYLEGVSRYGHDFGKCFYRKFDNTELLELKNIHPEFEAIMVSAINAFTEKNLQPESGANATAYLLATYLHTQAPPLLSLIRETTAGFEQLISKCSVVVTMPGRLMESNILYGLAKRNGIVSISIDGGPVGPTGRFINPAADEVICPDEISRNVYADFAGRSRSSIFVMGSPRIDIQLAPLRKMGRDEARRAIPELAACRTGRSFWLRHSPPARKTWRIWSRQRSSPVKICPIQSCLSSSIPTSSRPIRTCIAPWRIVTAIAT